MRSQRYVWAQKHSLSANNDMYSLHILITHFLKPDLRDNVSGCLSIRSSRPFLWTQYLKNAWREFLQILHISSSVLGSWQCGYGYLNSISSFKCGNRIWHFIYLGVMVGCGTTVVLMISVFLKSYIPVYSNASLKDTGSVWGQASEEQPVHRLPCATVHLHHVQCHGGCQGPVSQAVYCGPGAGGMSIESHHF